MAFHTLLCSECYEDVFTPTGVQGVQGVASSFIKHEGATC
jgi:hypothetical protein